MIEDLKHHTKSDIYIFLKRSFFAVVSYNSKDDDGNDIIKSELMVFNTTEDGNFYLTVKKSKDFFESIKDNPNITLLVYKEEELLEDIKRVVVNAEAKLIDDLDSEEAEKGFEIIGEKSPLVRHLIYADEEDRNEYTLIYAEAKTIDFISIKESMENKESTVLARK